MNGVRRCERSANVKMPKSAKDVAKGRSVEKNHAIRKNVGMIHAKKGINVGMIRANEEIAKGPEMNEMLVDVGATKF